MFADSGLYTSFFISTDDIIIRAQKFSLPLLGIQIKHSASFFKEFGVSGINP